MCLAHFASINLTSHRHFYFYLTCLTAFLDSVMTTGWKLANLTLPEWWHDERQPKTMGQMAWAKKSVRPRRTSRSPSKLRDLHRHRHLIMQMFYFQQFDGESCLACISLFGIIFRWATDKMLLMQKTLGQLQDAPLHQYSSASRQFCCIWTRGRRPGGLRPSNDYLPPWVPASWKANFSQL